MRVPESLYHGSRVVGLQGGCFGEEARPRPSPEGVNGRGDTSPRFDALPRGNGRWRSRNAVGGERFAGLRIVWRKKTIEAGSLRCKEKEGCCPGKGGFSVADSRTGWVWSQLWPVTLRLGLTGSIHKVSGPACRLSTFFSPMDPFHLHHTQTWTEMFATTAQLSSVPCSDSSSKGNPPLSWLRLSCGHVASGQSVSQSALAKSNHSSSCWPVRPRPKSCRARRPVARRQ